MPSDPQNPGQIASVHQREAFLATRDLVGWNGERVLTGMEAPIADWPDDYVQHLVAEGTLKIEQVDLVEPTVTVVSADDLPPETTVVDAAGEAVRPPQGGGAE